MGFSTSRGIGVFIPASTMKKIMEKIPEPIVRSPLRQTLGKEFYIARRRLKWLLGKQKWAQQRSGDFNQNIVFEHRSTILRKLQGVDMQLQENKRRNLELAIAHLDQMVIRQGETFSIWRNVGRPTKSKGYKEGLVLKQGQLDSDTGGGLCQLGNLLFWMFAHSPLKVTERYRHGFDVFPDVNRTVPFGAGATLSYNYIDLQVVNPTVDDFKIELWLSEKSLHGRLLCESPLENSYRVEERNHQFRQQFWGGYTRHNEIVQIETAPNGRETERLLARNNAIMMYSPMLDGPADDTNI